MKLVILPGNSPDNKAWADLVEQTFAPNFASVHKQYYRHWTEGREVINFETELKVLSDAVKSDEPCVVMAKSAGTVLTMLAVSQNLIKPRRCFFFGCPFKWEPTQKIDLTEIVQTFPISTIVTQNTADHVATFAEVKAILANNPNFTVVEGHEAGHDYDNLESVTSKVLE
jgi:predicted alpha/beta-hydrolase family hydrolase